MNGINYFKV